MTHDAAFRAPGAHDAEAIRKHVRVYFFVFGALLFLTVVTVCAAYFLHLPATYGVALALAIAVAKGSLVACFFMHLISERGIIYWVLAISAVFFLALLLLPVFTSVEMAGT
jgi:cytochrome c oxidase subunit 4